MDEKNLHQLFFYLNLNDILNCRLINKLWNQAVLNYKIKSLAVLTYKSETCEDVYFVTNRKVKYASTIFRTNNSNVYQGDLMKNMLSKLETLFIADGRTGYSTFSLDTNINHLKTLIHLQFRYLDTIKGRSLKLPKLKYLYIKQYTKENGLKLASKELTDFKTDVTLNHFSFNFPKKLINLEVENLMEFKTKINQFENLEKLTVRDADSLPEDILKLLPSLIELNIEIISKDRLAYLVKQKKVLRRLKLKITVRHILIQTNDDIDNFYANDDFDIKLTKLFTKKFDNLPHYLTWIIYLNFSELEKFFKSKLPIDLNSRLLNLNKLSITQPINDINFFNQFIKNCEKLQHLEIDSAEIDQSVYDELHNLCNSLTTLKINETKNLDLEFILSHINLEKFSTNQELSMDIFFNIKQYLKRLNNLEFKLNGKNVWVQLSYWNSKFKLEDDQAEFQNEQTMMQFLKIFLIDE